MMTQLKNIIDRQWLCIEGEYGEHYLRPLDARRKMDEETHFELESILLEMQQEKGGRKPGQPWPNVE